MTRDQILNERGASWSRLEKLLTRGESLRGLSGLRPREIREFSELYRSIAGDLMRVRVERLGTDLESHLDHLASRAHNLLYAGTGVGNPFRPIDLLLDFPGAVRRNWRFVAIAALLFYLPFLVVGLAAYHDESYALSIIPAENLTQLEEMYRHKGVRDVATDSQATGFYVFNNVGIAFRCFSTGLLFGVGSMFYLLYNGLVIGAVIGHLIRSGLSEQILGFVATHAPWELNAIVLSGAAGIQMGFALVRTHGRTRFGNLQAHGLELLRQLAGAAAFLLLAAALEGNVSPSALPLTVRYGLGIVGTALVLALLVFGGFRRPLPADVVALREAR